MRTRLLITALLSLLLLAGTASAENNTIVLDDLLKEAAAANPELAGLKAKYQAARERAPQEGSLEDPMLGIGITNLPVDSFAFDRDGMTGKEVELSQALPFAGKRGLKSIAAMHEAVALEQEYLDRVLTLRSEVKSVYYELYSEKKSLEIIGRNLELLDAFKKTTESRYSVGEGSLKDIIKIQVESAMLVDKRIQIEKEQHTKRAYLASLIGRDRPVEGEIPDITATPVDLDRGHLAAVAGTNRPTLRATQERIEKGSSMVELARKDFYPDFTVTARYMFRDNTRTPEGSMNQPDMLSMMLSMNLPVYTKSKQGPALRQAAFEKTMAERELDTAKKQILYKIDSLANEIEQADRTLKLYKEVIIPSATEDINTGLAGYSAGKAEFMGLLDSRRTLLEYETGYYNMLAERQKALAELEAAVGAELAK